MTTAEKPHSIAALVAALADGAPSGAAPPRPVFAAEDLPAMADPRAPALRTIPRSHAWARLDAPELDARVANVDAVLGARVIATELLGPAPPRVVLTGGAGTGKTTLACALLAAVIGAGGKRGIGARFVGAYWLAKARQQHRLGQGEAPEIEEAVEATVLVLDDVGLEQAANTALSEVVYERHAAERPTIITTGFGFKALVERYGDGIARRMTEGARIVKCGTAAKAGA